MIELNLLPDIKKEFIRAQKTKALVISSSVVTTLVAVGISVLLFIYVVFIQQLQISLTTNDIKNKQQQLGSIADLSKYLTVQNQLTALPDLHDQKGAYSRLFSFLPTLTPSAPDTIKLSALQVSSLDKTVLFTGTTPNFQSLNVFVDTLRNAQVSYKSAGNDQAQTDKAFDSVIVQSGSLAKLNNSSVVAFAVRAIYKDAVFDAKNNEVSVTVPNIQTTQSIVNSPQPLFNGSKPEGQ